MLDIANCGVRLFLEQAETKKSALCIRRTTNTSQREEVIMNYPTESARSKQSALLWILLAVFLVPTALSGCSGGGKGNLPDSISLPTGFRPEGIAIANNKLYAGSIPTGRVYRADVITGDGEVIVETKTGRSSIGLKVDDRGRIFVAGGATGKAWVYDAATGADIAEYALTAGPTFINDVVLTDHAAWFTDSTNPVLYRVDIAPNGSLGAAAKPFPLSGAIQFRTGTNVNGIAATPDGSALLVIQTNTGTLFSVDLGTGIATAVNLGTESLANGDGILLQGHTLYVVQNRSNLLAVVSMADDFKSGVVTNRVANDAFDVPTTVAASDGNLYLVNARFGTVQDPDAADYAVIRIRKP
jgi:sugar lactone lactonase YvrE